MSAAATLAAAPATRQYVYSSEAPLGKRRSDPYAIRNRTAQPLRSFSPERSPYLYSSVTSNGCFTVTSPTRSAQVTQQRQGKAVCPVAPPPSLDSHARRGFNAFDQQQRGLVRQAWRHYERDVLAPAQREALLEELIVLSPAKFSGELAHLQNAKREEKNNKERGRLNNTASCSSHNNTTSRSDVHMCEFDERPAARSPSRPATANGFSPISPHSWSHASLELSPIAEHGMSSPLWASVGSRYVASPSNTPLHPRREKRLFEAGTPLSACVPRGAGSVTSATSMKQNRKQQPLRGASPPLPAATPSSQRHTPCDARGVTLHHDTALDDDDDDDDDEEEGHNGTLSRPPKPRRATSAMPRLSNAAPQTYPCAPSRPRHVAPAALSPQHFRMSLTSSSSLVAMKASSAGGATPSSRLVVPDARGIGALHPSTYAPITKVALTHS